MRRADARADKVGRAGRGLLWLLVVAWLMGSLAAGGFRQTAGDVRAWLRGEWRSRPGEPDAVRQWEGPYYDALEVLVRQPRAKERTVAAVLTAGDRVLQESNPERNYETTYRLYPTRVEYYLAASDGSYRLTWMPSPPEHVPAASELWEHDYVLWADADMPQDPKGYRLIYANSEARVYQREGG